MIGSSAEAGHTDFDFPYFWKGRGGLSVCRRGKCEGFFFSPFKDVSVRQVCGTLQKIAHMMRCILQEDKVCTTLLSSRGGGTKPEIKVQYTCPDSSCKTH